jgi:hypothetical protein
MNWRIISDKNTKYHQEALKAQKFISNKTKQVLEPQNTLDDWQRLSFPKAQKQPISLNGRQSLTELSVICIIAEDWGKLDGQWYCLSVCLTESCLKVTQRHKKVLQQVIMRGQDPKEEDATALASATQ